MICAKCGALMDQTDKNSFTGRVIREYECRKCGHTDWEDDGVALWQALENLEENHEAKVAAQAAKNAAPPHPDPPHPDPPQPSPRPPVSLWQRLIDLFRRKRSLR